MADKKIAEYFLKVPQVIVVQIKPFNRFEFTPAILTCSFYSIIAYAGMGLISAFFIPIGAVIPFLIGVITFLLSFLIFTIGGYQHEIVRTLRLLSGYTTKTVPRDVPLFRLSMRVPFKTRRIFLGRFETDVDENSPSQRIVIATGRKAKKVGTHRVENYLIVKPGKVMFKQYVYLTEFGLMYHDFQGDLKKNNHKG